MLSYIGLRCVLRPENWGKVNNHRLLNNTSNSTAMAWRTLGRDVFVSHGEDKRGEIIDSWPPTLNFATKQRVALDSCTSNFFTAM